MTGEDDYIELTDDNDDFDSFEDALFMGDDADDEEDTDERSFDEPIDFSEQFNSSEDTGTSVKKPAIILIVIGVVLVIALVAIGVNLGKSKKASNASTKQTQQSTVSTKESTTSTKQNSTSSSDEWKSISNDEDITVNDDYVQLSFTVTSVKHYAKAVEDVVVIKTTVWGSISGLKGTYSIDLPYTSGSKVKVGMTFDIDVLLGGYKDRTVLIDIKY